MTSSLTKLSSSTTVQRYRSLELGGEREKIAEFIIERFDERYFKPLLSCKYKSGFMILAVACLVIETMESFYQGIPTTSGKGKGIFRSFFNRHPQLMQFIEGGDWFYSEIRCGILHQSETSGGWRVRRAGAILDTNQRTINASKLIAELRISLIQYAGELQTDDEVWRRFTQKMNSVCGNCT